VLLVLRLFHAAAKGHRAIEKLLLGTASADVEFQSRYGTPLSNAAANGRKDVVKMLLEAKGSEIVATLVSKAGLHQSWAKSVL
jgi:ankyrin repeat protein